MIECRCARCGCELEEPGALLFGPPDPVGRTQKRHFCQGCYAVVLAGLMGLVVPVEQLRALVRMLFPDEMTPAAKMQFDKLTDPEEPRA